MTQPTAQARRLCSGRWRWRNTRARAMLHDPYPQTFASDEAFALRLDAADPLRACRDRFHLPNGADGKPLELTLAFKAN